MSLIQSKLPSQLDMYTSKYLNKMNDTSINEVLNVLSLKDCFISKGTLVWI